MVRCIAIDLDGTTLNKDGQLTDVTRRTLQHALEKEVQIVIASGRAFSTLPKEVVDIEGIEYAITGNGAAIYRLSDGQCLRRHFLKEQAVDEILKCCSTENVLFETFIEGIAYAEARYIDDPLRYGAGQQSVEYIKRTRNSVLGMEKFILDNKSRLDSIDVIIPEHEKKAGFWKRLTAEVSDIYITSSVNQMLEISDENSGKGRALQFLAEYLGINQAETAAFGDAENDVEMIKYAGTGIAVADACESLKEAADFVTEPSYQNGVALAIESILKQNNE